MKLDNREENWFGNRQHNHSPLDQKSEERKSDMLYVFSNQLFKLSILVRYCVPFSSKHRKTIPFLERSFKVNDLKTSFRIYHYHSSIQIFEVLVE